MGNNSYTIKIPFASGRKHLNEELTIEDLKRISEPIIDSAIAPVNDALDKAGLDSSDIDLVILAGGSSQLPGVYEKIQEEIGVEPRTIPKNLMLAISYGASLYQKEVFKLPTAKREVRTLGSSLGIEVYENGRPGTQLLLNHNQKLPAVYTKTFYPIEGVDVVSINLVTLIGNSDRIDKRLKQRNIKISEDTSEIKVEVKVTENRLIELSAYDPQNPKEKAIIQVTNKILSASDIEEKQKQLGIEIISGESRKNLQPCIGIDLGTTTSELSYTNRTGEPELHFLENKDVPKQYSEYCFPSVVYFKDGFNNPEVANIKACDALGNADDADKVSANFKIARRDTYNLMIDGKGVSVSDLSAILLSKIWSTAKETFADMNLTSAVVTVPAAFDFDACQDTYNAAKLAGIDSVTLIDEPTAAYLYYKHVQDLDTSNIRNVLVFDFGGGTVDVAVLDVKNSSHSDSNEYKDCLFTVLGVSGNDKCGGKHIDDALMTEIQRRFEEKNSCKMSPVALRTLRGEIEKAKVALSESYNGMDD